MLKNELIPNYLLFKLFKTLVIMPIQSDNIKTTKFVTFYVQVAIICQKMFYYICVKFTFPKRTKGVVYVQ